jgi:Tfp pilus assembly protein PilN
VKAPALRLEFAPGARRRSRLGTALLAGAGAVLLVVAVAFTSAWSQRREDRLALAELAAREGRTARPVALPGKPDPAYLAKVKSVQRTTKSLTAPWPELFDAIESAPQQSVALLTMEPSTARHALRLTAEARDPQAMLTYLAALQADRRLASAVLVSHQVQLQAPGRPIRFQVLARWGES